MRTEIEDALAAWRDAARRLDNAVDGDLEALSAEVERHRDHFHRLSARHMMDRIDPLQRCRVDARRGRRCPPSLTARKRASRPPFRQRRAVKPRS